MPLQAHQSREQLVHMPLSQHLESSVAARQMQAASCRRPRQADGHVALPEHLLFTAAVQANSKGSMRNQTPQAHGLFRLPGGPGSDGCFPQPLTSSEVHAAGETFEAHLPCSLASQPGYPTTASQSCAGWSLLRSVTWSQADVCVARGWAALQQHLGWHMSQPGWPQRAAPCCTG